MEKLTRREFLRLTGGVALGATLAGCTTPATTTPGPAATSAPAAAPTLSSKAMTLQLPSWQFDEPGSSDWWKARIADFEKAHTNVHIEFSKVAVGDIATKGLAQFAAGTPPQIVHLPYLNMLQFADQGFLEPLDDWMKDTDLTKTWTPLQKGCVWKGKTYSILLLAYGYSMIYNEKLLKDAGQAVPTTPADFAKMVKATTKKPDVFGHGLPTISSFNLLTFMSVFLVGMGGRWTANGKPSVTTPEALEGFSMWADIVRSAATPTGMDTGPLRQLLQQGKLASWFDGPWGQGFIKTAAADVLPNLKVAPLPFAKVFGGSSNVVGMAANIPQEQKQMVWEFIKSLTNVAGQTDYVLKYCVAPARNDLNIPATTLHESCPLIDPWLAALKSPNLVDYYPFGFETKITDLTTAVTQFGQTLITSNASVKDEADKLQKKMEDLLKS